MSFPLIHMQRVTLEMLAQSGARCLLPLSELTDPQVCRQISAILSIFYSRRQTHIAKKRSGPVTSYQAVR